MKIRLLLLSLPLAISGHVFSQETPEDWPPPVKYNFNGMAIFDRFEIARTDEGDNVGVWDMIGWYGGDTYRLYFKSEGENVQGDGAPTDIERAELLASKLIAPFWELQMGLGTRGELSSSTNMEHYAVLSLYGMAPYQFEVDSSLILNEDGDMSFSMEAEYDLRLTQTSYLQPRLSMTASLSDSERFDRLSGFNDIRLGLRYRMEWSREFAPYVGVYWSKALGNTADAIQASGDSAIEKGVVVGARFWF